MFGLTGPWKFIIPGLVVLALITLIVIGARDWKAIDQEQDNSLVNSGITIERERSQGETINNVREAQDAVANPSGNDIRIVCEKYDRNCTSNNQ